MSKTTKLVVSLPQLPTRARDGHKGSFGTVLVVAGSPTMLGAAVLAATAALRGGAGLVQVALPPRLVSLLPLAVPCATTLGRGRDLDAALGKADAVVVGPGLGGGAATKSLVARVLRLARGPIVVDADGLNALAPLSAARRRSLAGSRVVLTPHPGEAGRLLGTTSSAVQKDRDAALAELCARSGATVVLKGAGTLVGDGTRCFHNRTGNPGMATGGTGDVLAGLLAALLAQGLAPFEAACLAAHVHGKAGDRVARRLGEVGLIAADLPTAIAEELA
ncbi:MAG: hypothetical protein RL398_2636 [Planctomycetota bacterium]|jgi:NAD(P)H-hydrate epimerase